MLIVPPAEITWRPSYPIVTARLRLRPHRLDDLDDLVLFHGDPEVTRYIPWPVRTKEQTLAALEIKCAQHEAREVGDWLVLAVEEAATGTVIGEVLLKRGEEGAAEVGYAFRRDRQGRGLAFEAVTALLATARDEFGRQSVEAVLDPANAASARLLSRLRFERVPSLDATLHRYLLRF